MEKIRQNLFFLFCIALITGIFLIDTVRVLPSIAMIAIVLLGLSYLYKKEPFARQKNYKPYLSLCFTFIILLPSWFYSSNSSYLYQKWQIALPLLVLPIAFMLIPQLPKRRYFQLYQFYFGMVLLTALTAFIYYLLNQEHINELYLQSKVMPALISHHPTLSIMIAFAIFIAYKLYMSGYYYRFEFERYLFALGGIFLFIFIHVFSVRSGLLALYLLIFTELALLAIQQKKVKAALITATLILFVGMLTLVLSPTFSNKIANTTQDLNDYKNNKSANNHSLSSRFISYKNAWQIANETSLFWGCGLGDIDELNTAIFQKDYPDVSKPILPHNQFLFYLAAIGISGVLLFILFFYYPLFIDGNFKNNYLLAHYIILFVAYQFEAPLETQLGVAYTIIFILIPLHQNLKN